MPQTIQEVMTSNPVCLAPNASVQDAAREMQENDIGAVLLTDGDQIAGIVTDRDIVVRSVAQGIDPVQTELQQICSEASATLSPDDSIDDAVDTMRSAAVRRLPVVENGKPVGVVAIGDLALARDEKSALADISGKQPNN